MHANLGYLLPTLVTTVGRKVLPLVKDYLDQRGVPLCSIISLASRDSTPEGCFDTAQLIETQLPISLGNELEWKLIPELLKTRALWDVQRDFLCDYTGIVTSLSLPSSPRFIGYHGWTADLRNWAGRAAMRAGRGAIRGFTPFRASRVEAVVAFQTDADWSIYVKCFAPLPFTEALVTRALGERYPESIAKTLDFCAERGWWAAEEVTGPSLGEHLRLEDCLDAIGRFARMQKELTACHAVFAEMGLRQLRLGEIDREIDAAIAGLDEVSALSFSELSGLSSLLSKAATALAELNSPESLVHGDLTPWNIKMSGQGPVFLDWEDAAWGPAIVSLEIFLAALRSPYRQLRDSGWLECIRDFYFEAWGPIDPRWEDPLMMRYSRALALFCQLRGYMRCWRDEPDVLRGRDSVVQAARKLHQILL
jgi:aminoglycoside phosphotransferase (APT) family kinase protein